MSVSNAVVQQGPVHGGTSVTLLPSAAVDGADRRATVVVCDDRPELRQAIGVALRDHALLRIVGEAEDGTSCLDEVDRCRPDLLILDVNMPGGGPTVARELRDRWPELFILVYSGMDRDRVSADMLAAGADRFVLKTGRLRPLLDALASAAA